MCNSRWERRRNDVDLETKMITARSRYESSLRSMQDLMLRINMREVRLLYNVVFFALIVLV